MSKNKISEPMHSDFRKILLQFQKRYGQEKGTQYFYMWVNKLGLDDTKPYSQSREKFQWAQSHFRFIKQDPTAKYYEVEAAFPLISMNMNVYTEFELERAARTLVGRPVNVNHESHVLKGVTVEDAEYEDGAVECLLKVLNNAGHGIGLNIQDMIEKGDVLNVSIEASCRRGIKRSPEGDVCLGLNFTGLALLTKDALPGIPLTRIVPVEAIVESFHVMENREMKEKQEAEKEKEPELESETETTEKIDALELQLSECGRKHQEMEEQVTQRNNEILELKTKIQGLTVEITRKNQEITTLQEQNKRLIERLKKAKRVGRIIVKV